MNQLVSEPSWEELAEAFAALVALTADEREARLAELTAARPRLAAELSSLLAVSDETHTLELEAGLAPWLTVPEPPPSLAPGSLCGPYRLLGPLAKGGMGEVFLAERADGSFSQRVAIKVMRPGIGSADLVDRFQLERELLARLTHPAVVPLLDGGTTAEGRPYLVLQYVEGLPITTHCVAHGLDRRQTLRLFRALCLAVQYAHANLVVHRDLKPSNILVSADGDVRLLDFGIAKLLAGRPSTLAATRADLAPMTPERAAPEQRRGEPITTATDVWALGLLLHELLLGELPPGALSGEIDLSRLAGRLGDRDLAAIVGRALEGEPAQRYPSAGELANDIERWLAHEPVRARSRSWGYRFQRFLARHRAAVLVAAVASAVVLALAGLSAFQGWRAAEASALAAREGDKAGRVLDLLVELLGTADPAAGAQRSTIEVEGLLAQGEKRAAALGGQPEIQARLRQTIGRIYLERGQVRQAEELLAAALTTESARLPADDPGLVELRFDHARALHAAGKVAEAAGALRTLLAQLEADPSADPILHAHVLAALGGQQIGAEAERLAREAVALLRAAPGADPTDVAGALTVLASQRMFAGDEAEATSLFREAYELQRAAWGEEHPAVLATRSNLANRLRDPVARAAEHEKVLALRRLVLGEHSQAVATSWGYLGLARAEQGDWAAAEAAFRRALTTWEAVVEPGHGRLAAARRNLAWALARQGSEAAALSHYAALAAGLGQPRGDLRASALYAAERAAELGRAGRGREASAQAEAVLAATAADAARHARSRALAAAAAGLVRLSAGEVEAARSDLAAAVAAAAALPAASLELAELRAAFGRALAAAGDPAGARRELASALPVLASWQGDPRDAAAAQAALASLH